MKRFALLLLTLSAACADTRVDDPARLAELVAQAAPGEVFVIPAGTYRDLNLRLSGHGTAAAPITIRAERVGEVVLSGNSTLRIGGEWLVVEGLSFRDGGVTGQVIQFRIDSDESASNCRLTRCSIVAYNPPDNDTDTKWIGIYGQNNRVDHCELTGKTNGGTTLVVWVGETPDRHRIDHNYFGPRQRLGRNGGETIRIGTSGVSMNSSQCVVEDNFFEGCDGELELISNKSCDNVYRRNTFSRCAATLTLRHGNRCTVEGNLFDGDGVKGSGGVRVIGEDHVVINNAFVNLAGTGSRSALAIMQGIPDSPLHGYFQVKRPRIAYNTFVGCASPVEMGTKGSGTELPPLDGTFSHNLIAGGARPVIKQLADPMGWTFTDNLVDGEDPGADGFRRVETLGLTEVFRLTPTSPAIEAGPAGPEFDVDGQRRDARPDLGCDELSDSPATPLPTKESVGPRADGQ